KYSEMARHAKTTGVVVVEAIIDKNGNVDQVKVIKGLPMGLSDAAEEAVRQWKFKPATLNGEPVDVIFNLTVNFTLQYGRAARCRTAGSARRRRALLPRAFPRDRLRLKEETEVVAAAGFGVCAGHVETTERMHADHRAGALAVDVEVADEKLFVRALDLV